MRLAFYTYSYIDRLGMEPEPVLRAAAEAGYDGIDISATWRSDLDPGMFPQERREEFRRLAEQFNLRIEAAVTHIGMLNALWEGLPINLPGAVDLAVDVGCPMVTVHLGTPGASGKSEAAGWNLAVSYLRESCAYAGERGVTICFDAVWPDYLVDTPEKGVRLIEEVGSDYFRHNFDPCYLLVAGFDLASASRMLAPYAAHAHIKDSVGRYPNWEHRIPGKGEVDHTVWAAALAEAGFAGAVTVECFTDMDLHEAAKDGYAAVSEAMRAVGARP